MKLRPSVLALALSVLPTVPLCAWGAGFEYDYGFKGRAVLGSEGHRDLGLTGANDDQQLYLDLLPWLHAELAPGFTGYLRVEAFLPTGDVLPDPGVNVNNEKVGSFVRLRELWVDYGGLTNYPGEVLRVGRQRLRQNDTTWWDDDVDAVRWMLDTSLLRAQLGAAEQFSSYRSDGAGINLAQKDRLYLFGSLEPQWRPGHRAGLRIAHAKDHNDLPEAGTFAGSETKLQDASLTWIGVQADGGFFEPSRTPRTISYWGQATWLTGDQKLALAGTDRLVTGRNSGNVNAWSGEAGLRWQMPDRPLQLGVAYAYGQGGDGSDAKYQFQQTGLQSNWSRFTGTGTLIPRFGDAFRAELSNLAAATAFASLNDPRYDISLVVQRLRRVDSSAPIVADGITVDPVTNSSDLGMSWDFVMSGYLFGGLSSKPVDYTPGEDIRSAVRLRSSLFQPGSAYGSDRKDRYRVSLEVSLWF